MGARVLVVDDEPIVRDVLGRYLSRDGFEVDQAGDGEAALACFQAAPPDLVVLDLMLPRKDGIEVFTRIREHGDTPVIMLTAKGQEADRIVGLEIGADDYIAKPFSPREVLARVRSVLRRAGVRAERRDPILEIGDLRIDPRAREVRRRGRRLVLTPKEFDLLHFLAANAGTAFTRTELLDELWDFAFDGDPSTVTVHVRRLRAKVEEKPSRPRHLVTVWGVGYRFDP
jgi:two-component system, OmpR family, response regulator ResD